MPQDTEDAKAGITKTRAQVAAQMPSSTDADRAARRKFIAAQGSGKMSDSELQEDAYRQRNANEANKVLGNFHKGGKVKKTGLYKLQEGEKVVAKKDTEKDSKVEKRAAGVLGGAKKHSKSSGKKKRVKEIRVRRAENGGRIAVHSHDMDEETGVIPRDEDHILPPGSSIEDHFNEHMPEEEEPEEKEENQQPGVDAAAGAMKQ